MYARWQIFPLRQAAVKYKALSHNIFSFPVIPVAELYCPKH